MATTTTAQTKVASSLPLKAALGLLSSLPTTNPTLKIVQRALPLLPPSILPNFPNLGNGQSSSMAATLPTGMGAQNPTNNNANNTNQNNMCEVWKWPSVHRGSVPHRPHPPFIELPPTPQVARPRFRSATQLLFESLRESQRRCSELRGTVLRVGDLPPIGD